MKKKGIFKRKEVVDVIHEETADGQFSGRTLCVSVQKVKPVFADDDGENERRGPAQVDVFISRGERAKVAVTASEAKSLHEILGFVIADAEKADAVCRTEKEAWRRRHGEDNKDNVYKPRSDNDFSMGKGKTARNKKKGKAGKAVHQRKKAEKAQKERARQAAMGHVEKK